MNLKTNPINLSAPVENNNPMKIKSKTGFSPLRLLREKKGMSQQALAGKMGVIRNHLVRIENKSWKKLTVKDLDLVALGLNAKTEEIFQYLESFGKDGIQGADLKRPAFIVDTGKGARFASFLKKPAACFAGSFTLDPQKILAKKEAPRAGFVFYYVLKGAVCVKAAVSERSFEANGFFYFESNAAYELYNPDPFQPLVALFFCTPSFIH
jgi:transcriptional regulator with XRE-family HTH domain